MSMELVANRRSFRLSVIAVALVLMFASAWHATVMSFRSLRPQIAVMLKADEPIAAPKMAAVVASRALENKLGAPEIVEPLRNSLRVMALNPGALRLLAISKTGTLESDPDFALVELSNEVSRRDLGTQALLIRKGVESNDLGLVLRSYDTALRTSERSWDLFFPNLARAIEIPGIEPDFREIMADNPPWLDDFLLFAMERTEDPRILYQYIIRSENVRQFARRDEIYNGLTSRLVSAGLLDLARNVFIRFDLGDPEILVSPELRADWLDRRGNIMLWQFAEVDGYGAQPLGGTVMSIYANPGRAGRAASKILFLDPGRYVFSAKVQGGASELLDATEWTLGCLGGQSETGQSLPFTQSRTTQGGETGLRLSFAVPANCQAVLLALDVDGGDSQLSNDLLLGDLRLSKAL